MELIGLWNSQADEFNQWDNLGEDEKLIFAMKFERDKCLLIVLNIWSKFYKDETAEALEECIDAIIDRNKE
jgi:hypothetical protein